MKYTSPLLCHGLVGTRKTREALENSLVFLQACFIAALHGESPVAAAIGFIGCIYPRGAKKIDTEKLGKCSGVSFPPGMGLLQGGVISSSTFSLWPIPCTKLKARSQLVSAKVMLLLHIRNSLSLWVLCL